MEDNKEPILSGKGIIAQIEDIKEYKPIDSKRFEEIAKELSESWNYVKEEIVKIYGRNL